MNEGGSKEKERFTDDYSIAAFIFDLILTRILNLKKIKYDK